MKSHLILFLTAASNGIEIWFQSRKKKESKLKKISLSIAYIKVFSLSLSLSYFLSLAEYGTEPQVVMNKLHIRNGMVA